MRETKSLFCGRTRSAFLLTPCSFLDSSNNTDLIRWSDDGNSFIVLDEDEFARTLIPELFKHNNYASFVRQLNMYGFHKKVGLNANSMKAAEKKVKDPNVYWHEYFKRGRPDLLWLIQKPQSKSNSKRKRGDEKRDPGDSDDDTRRTSPEANDSNNLARSRAAQNQMAPLAHTELSGMRSELQKLQRQQGVISKMISQLKEQNEQFYRQATAFQALHDRHENSINAILTFLATFYNRSLEGHSAQNLVNMFQNAIPQANQPQHGSVVDCGDLPDTNIDTNQQLQRFPKRPLALLPAPMVGQNMRPSAAASTPPTNPSSARPSLSPTMAHAQRNLSTPAVPTQQYQRASSTPHIKDDADTPNFLNQLHENDDMMSLINDVNASNNASPNAPGAPNFDFSSALDHFQNANGASPLTPQQRDSMLSLIAQQGQPSTSQPGANNALVAPTPPPMPSLDHIQRTQQQLDMLTRLQQDQDSKVADLAGRLQPLSPSGAILGMTGDGTDPLNSGDFDINAYINSDDGYFGNHFSTTMPGDSNAPAPVGSNVDGSDMDFSNLTDADNLYFDPNAPTLGDGAEDDLFGDFDNNVAGGDGSSGGESRDEQDGGGRIVGSVTSEETSPAQAAMTDYGGDGETPGSVVGGDTPGKKRRIG